MSGLRAGQFSRPWSPASSSGGIATATPPVRNPVSAPRPISDYSDADLARIAKALVTALTDTASPTLLGSPPLAGTGVGDGTPPLLGTAPVNPNRPDTPNNDYIHGVKGKLKYAYNTTGTPTYTEFYIEQISLDDEVDTDDITNSSSQGGQVILDGIQKISGTITFVYDALNCFLVPTASPFKPRTYVLLQVYPDGVTIGASFCALMSGYSYGTGPKAGTVRVACKYQSTGPITYPTVSALVPTPALTS